MFVRLNSLSAQIFSPKSLSVLILKTIAIMYFSVIAFGTLFSGAMYWVDRQPVYRAHFQLWVAALIVFGCNGAFTNLDLTGFLAFTSTCLVILTVLHIFNLAFEVKLPMNKYFIWVALGIVTSAACFMAHLPFGISSTPYIIGLNISCCSAMYLGIKRVPNTALRNGFLVLIGLTALHMADYPFLRPDPTMAVAGFSIALGLDFCYASFIPLAIVKTQSERSTLLLEQMVQERTRELQSANEVLSEAKATLSSKNYELQNLSDHNRALTSVLVHDLATPIAVVQSSLPRLEQLLQSEMDHKVFGRISRSITTLADTTDRVRREHAIRTGKKAAEVPNAEIQSSLSEVIEKMAQDFEGALHGKHLKLDFSKCDPELKVVAEPETLKNQVLSNLLSNAIKFSHPGGKISISTDIRDGEVFIRIQDNGVGVPIDMREEIFRDDKPTTSHGTEGEVGTGFGLPIVRHFVRKMGGDVRVSDSIQEKGACFEVTLKKSA